METRSWALGNTIRAARMNRGYTQEQLHHLKEQGNGGVAPAALHLL